MRKKLVGILLSLLCSVTVVACSSVVNNNDSHIIDENASTNSKPSGKYNEGVVLVKASDFSSDLLRELEYVDVEQLYAGSKWYKVILPSEADTEEAVSYLIGQNTFEKVDYDYLMGSDGDVVDISSNPLATEQTYLDNQKIKDGWDYITGQGKFAGGSSDVVVAVIDTGVDYNHIDLRNNIWTNSAEIPNNGKDDDNNGYVDDYYGWDCVGNDKDPMDDNGHGTHVAGIIAAENNSFGTVGIAYKCKIMCIKAGNSSGYFTNSDIAKAIQYAYMNGASVINMSFGGSLISSAVEDALEDAYNTCVLVAAAGNDGLCNNLAHFTKHDVGVIYPAALSYVIGVMSTNSTGTIVSSFSNYDDIPYNSVEYEVYACGEQIPSTWPNNKIARLSGTSMACPVVAGIAALLRSTYTDRDVYSTKYIQSQIVNTGSIHPFNTRINNYDSYHNFTNAYDALTKIPKPAVSFYEYAIYDNVEYSNKNNGNGIIDAGETIRIEVLLHNRGGVASNVDVTIDTIRNNDPSLVDPYFNIVKSSLSLSDIGTYSLRNGGRIYDNGNIIGVENYFEIVVDDACPNDYLSTFNIHFTYKNGLDENDNITYFNTDKFVLSIQAGESLPSLINSDLTLSSNKLYFLDHNVIIENGVTLTVEANTKIVGYTNSFNQLDSPIISNYGTIVFAGTEDEMINLENSDSYYGFIIYLDNYGSVSFSYSNVHNLAIAQKSSISNTHIDHCNLMFDLNDGEPVYREISNGGDSGCLSSDKSGIKSMVSSGDIEITNSFLDGYGISSPSANLTISNCYTNNTFIYFGSLPNLNISDNLILNTKIWCGSTPQSFNITNNLIVTNSKKISFDFGSYNYSKYSNYDINICKNKLVGEISNYLNNGLISGIRTSDGILIANFENDKENYDMSKIWPYVNNIEIINKNSETVNKIGKEEVTFKVYFNQPVVLDEFSLYFGTVMPYSDYEIKGDTTGVSDVWTGTYTLKSFIENGNQYYKYGNAYSSNDSFKFLCDYTFEYGFDIDTTAALSMDLQAYANDNGINLEWQQDDYDTLMGYNVYRSSSKDGNFIKLNTSVIPENTFVDENAEPGVNYWYTFTVVFSDLTESNPAGKVSCTALDTIKPTIYHTPVNQGYTNNNLVISCTASDNVGVISVVLYYRTIGNTNFTSINMSKQSNKYSAMIFGSDLTTDGIEYYIVASDGINEISKGTAEDTYKVTIKDSSTIAILGDVDGDGQITTKDALMIMQAINGDLILTDDQFQKADLNKDGELSSVEALRILQYINGNVTTLQM